VWCVQVGSVPIINENDVLSIPDRRKLFSGANQATPWPERKLSRPWFAFVISKNRREQTSTICLQNCVFL